jgi:hypothetical protein
MKTITADQVKRIVRESFATENGYEFVTAKINDYFNTSSQQTKLTGSVLMEAVDGMMTIPWLSMPPRYQQKWEDTAKEITDIVLGSTHGEPITEQWLWEHKFKCVMDVLVAVGGHKCLIYDLEDKTFFISVPCGEPELIPTPSNTAELEMLMRLLGIL